MTSGGPYGIQQYDDDLDAASEQARGQGDLTPLVQTVRRWWFEADAWRDPGAQRQFLARVECPSAAYRAFTLPDCAHVGRAAHD